MESLLNSIKDYISRKIGKLSCECRVRNKEGEYFWIQLKGQGIWNNQGKIISLLTL